VGGNKIQRDMPLTRALLMLQRCSNGAPTGARRAHGWRRAGAPKGARRRSDRHDGRTAGAGQALLKGHDGARTGTTALLNGHDMRS
jgi:hypothetical protein